MGWWVHQDLTQRRSEKACFVTIRAMSFARTEGKFEPATTAAGRPSQFSYRRGLTGQPSVFGATESPEEEDYERSMRQKEPPARGRTLPTLRRAWPKDGPLAAICVQSVDVQCVLQFTLIHAAGCVLHRRTSRVIHRLKLFFTFSFVCSTELVLPPAEACR